MNDKKKIKVCEVGYSLDVFKRIIKEGAMSSHLLYGAYQLEKDEDLEISYYSIRGGILKRIYSLVKQSADVVFFPYIYTDKLFFILLTLKYLHIIHNKYVGILHCPPRKSNFLYRFMFHRFDWLFFHSALNKDEAIKAGFARKESSSVLPWGMDLKDYPQSTTTGNYFISSGMENRDYNILVEALKLHPFPFKLFMPKKYAEAHPVHENIQKLNLPQVESVLVTQSEDTIKKLSQEVRDALAVVIPIKTKALIYCVGHTNMVEACALGKPIIVADNPYHPIDVEKEGIGVKFIAGNAKSLKQALEKVYNNPQKAKEMGQKARNLAETRYNINNCAKHLKEVCIAVAQ